MLDETVVQRLAFIKYLYGTAVEQSRQPDPLAASSLLTFHDSVELFLQLSAEHLDAQTTPKTQFLQYWNLLNEELGANKLTQRESMRRLNSARVQLKHNGTMPSKLALESFRSSVTSFFEDSTPLVFGIGFDSISMINLVSHAAARANLERAKQLMDAGNVPEALREIAIAFERLLKDYRERTGIGFRELRTPFSYHIPTSKLGAQMSTDTLKHQLKGVKTDKLRKILVSVMVALSDVLKSVTELQRALNVMTLGLDYRRYARFHQATPHNVAIMEQYVRPGISKENVFPGTWVPQGREETVTLDDCIFCMDYVIECAIKLQEFAFTDAWELIREQYRYNAP
jgi:hypothetical protein